MAELVIREGLSVRQLEKLLQEKVEDKNIKNVKPEKPSNIINLEESLMSVLGTKVQLKGNNKKGKIEIEYYGLEDLDRIIEMLTK